MKVTLTVEEIELIQLAMECLYSELPEYNSINEKLRVMRENLLSKDAFENDSI